jgi:hypothetical protein
MPGVFHHPVGFGWLVLVPFKPADHNAAGPPALEDHP